MSLKIPDKGEIANTGLNYRKIIDYVDDGNIHIPDFQRKFVWTKNKILDLLDSIYKGYPIGSFIFWVTDQDFVYSSSISGKEIKSNPFNAKYFVIDGQQRLKSLYHAAKSKELEMRKDQSNLSVTKKIDVIFDLEEIAEVSQTSRKVVGRNHRALVRGLGLKMMPPSPMEYIPRFCSKLGLSGDVQTKTLEILKEAADHEIVSGRGPVGVAAASLYIASVLCGEKRVQREIADIAGVTEVTIRNRYKEIVGKLDIRDYSVELKVYTKPSIIGNLFDG